MWRTRLSRTWDWLRSRRLVGEDEQHLFYSEYLSKDQPERRYVEYKDRDITNSSDRMPVEWWAWLHNRRDTPPTELELASSAQKKAALAQRVAVLEAEDEKQRLRHSITGAMQADGAAHRREQRARKRKNVLLELANKPTPAADTSQFSDLQHSFAGKDRKTGADAERNQEEDPTGTGETFQPGSWVPSSARRGRKA